MGQHKTKHEMDKIDLKPKTNPIHEDYEIVDKKLGFGINGSVLMCIERNTRVEYALKVFLLLVPFKTSFCNNSLKLIGFT